MTEHVTESGTLTTVALLKTALHLGGDGRNQPPCKPLEISYKSDRFLKYSYS